MKMQSRVTGQGRPVVLVPGGLTGMVSWEKHTEKLSLVEKVINLQLLSVQLGLENKSLPNDYSVKLESKALGLAIEDLNVEKPFDIAAWSYGALITLDYVLDNPENIRSVTLIEPPAIWVLRSKGPLDYDTNKKIKFLESLRGNITEEMLEQFLYSVGFAHSGQSVRQLPQWQAWLPFRQSLRNAPHAIAHKDDIKRLRSFNKPVLLVKGIGSANFLHQIIDTLFEYLPNVKLTEMPAGHAPHIVSMDRFLNELQEFQSA